MRPHDHDLPGSKTFGSVSLYRLVILFLKVFMLRKSLYGISSHIRFHNFKYCELIGSSGDGPLFRTEIRRSIFDKPILCPNWEIRFNRPFVRSGHVVRNKLCWEANNSNGSSKPKQLLPIQPDLFASQHNFSVPRDRIVQRVPFSSGIPTEL